MTRGLSSQYRRIARVVLLVAAGLGCVVFGIRSYNSYWLLHSAQALGVPRVGTIRPWMTLGYVADTYQIPRAALRDGLGLPATMSLDTSLGAIAVSRSSLPVSYMGEVQRAVVKLMPAIPHDAAEKARTEFGYISQETLAALLVAGYPILAAILFLGAVGLPFPTGLATIIAGSLAASGKMSWPLAGSIALLASLAGDMIGYGIGRLAQPAWLVHRASWLGYTAERHAQVSAHFVRWAWFVVLLTRTLVSSMSAAVNLVAGASHYAPTRFIAVAIVGRFLWTSAYLALGFSAGSDLEAASAFLSNLSLFFVMVGAFAGIKLLFAPQPRAR